MDAQLRDVMSTPPAVVEVSAPIVDAARAMRDLDIGDVLVVDGEQLFGILTDRDITVRAVAQGTPLEAVTAGDVCSTGVLTLSADQTVEDAVRLMSDNALRRVPITEDQRLVGIVSLGDLAVEREPDSVLSEISSAPANG